MAICSVMIWATSILIANYQICMQIWLAASFFPDSIASTRHAYERFSGAFFGQILSFPCNCESVGWWLSLVKACNLWFPRGLTLRMCHGHCLRVSRCALRCLHVTDHYKFARKGLNVNFTTLECSLMFLCFWVVEMEQLRL